jgi:inner membrane protein
VPFSINEPGEDNQGTKERYGMAHFLPETLNADGVLYPETRKARNLQGCGIRRETQLKGSFAQPDVSQLDLQNATYNWSAAYFTIGITDMRGIKNLPELVINGQKCTVEPGVADTDLFQSGLTVKAHSLDLNQAMNFEIELVLNGSENLSVEALGKTSEVTIRSDWTETELYRRISSGSDRQVTPQGFTAEWHVTHLNRNFPQQWVDRKYNTNEAKLGVQLLIPVDHYHKSMRSAKYAILFIALNFLIFIFIEIKGKTRIHPFQYTLVAFALLIFYALLTSISEQTGFNWAYLISAVAVTCLITWYAFAMLKNSRMVGWVTLLQTALYLFLFTLLQLQDYALLAGSIGLFVILAIIMRASQQIKWYTE